MIKYFAATAQVAVIGAGHAGCEAALAAARLGSLCLLFTTNLDQIANMACNPNIGGTAKGHLAVEIDALGGQMGKIADASKIQARMLNSAKGPAVHSLRAQVDRSLYHRLMKKSLEQNENILLKQAEIISIERGDFLQSSHHYSFRLTTANNAQYYADTVIVATGTYLCSKILIGENSFQAGPDGAFGANRLSQSIRDLGIPLRRFKTGTPVRMDGKTLDYSKMIKQEGDQEICNFSFETTHKNENKVTCYLTYTTEDTHRIIRENIHRSPMYSGQVKGVGARYCPSIEDKIVKFPDKERHQLFIEPMGLDTCEMYLAGMSTSLPEEVQLKIVRTVPGLENAQIMRTAYAIEYDCIDPTELSPSLEFRNIPGLFGAGQFNGSSGYEEAAAQGLIAGINAARKIQNKPPIIITRAMGYIGVLIDDLVTKGTPEPYRMMTSRAEYRLLLRQDNADARLTPLGYQIGLISHERYQSFLHKMDQISDEISRVKAVNIAPSTTLAEILDKNQSTAITTGIKLSELIKRPELNYFKLAAVDTDRPLLPPEVVNQVDISIKYEGYIKRQLEQVKDFENLEKISIPEDIDYKELHGLRIEARQKLAAHMPPNVGLASRISGVSPADINALLIHIKKR